MARLVRESDGEGYAGSRVEIIIPNERAEAFNGDASTLVGNMLLVGTVTGGMFSQRDWWRTNVIAEIISETEDVIRFKTKSGSTYTFRR